MFDAYDLTKMLEEIIEDEKVSTPKNRKISQEDIKRMLIERRRLAAQAKEKSKTPLAEALMQAGLISREQLESALDFQSTKGGKIGSILTELGYITDEGLLEFLGKQYGIQSTSLFNADITDDVMRLLHPRTILKHRVLPLKIEGRSVHLAIESPNDTAAIQEVEFLTGKPVTPFVIPSYQMNLVVKYIQERKGETFTGVELQQALKGSMTIQTLLEYLVVSEGSDILITAGAPPSVKVNNSLKRASIPPLTPGQCEACAKALMSKAQWEEFQSRKEIDFSIDYEDKGRFRVNAYRQKNAVSLVIRRILDAVLSFDALGLPEWLEDFLLKPQGLILVAASGGHGKTTSVAAMVDLINRRRRCNIITLEDPIEYLHKSLESNINQREIGTDTDSWAEGMRRILKQAPDVIVIGEIRDHDTLEAVLEAASTGHLILSSILASNSTKAIENLLNLCPNHVKPQILRQLADVLLLIFAQKLVPGGGDESLVLAYEKLLNSHRIKDFIRENRVHEIRAQIERESDDFATVDVRLGELVEEGRVAMEDALLCADDPYYLMKMGA